MWRVHDFDALLREAYESGLVCAGISAGAVCWFEGAVTDALHPELRPLHDGLGLLPGPWCRTPTARPIVARRSTG